VPAFDTLKTWGAEHGVSESSPEAWLANSKVHALIKKELEECAGKLKGFEEVRDFAMVAEDFTTENGMLTPSMKLKRKKVLEVHGALLDSLYTKKKSEKEARA
jgi:long-chain acyl-CoA synthetase